MKIKRWITVRISFLWLTLSIFLASYFPAISHYTINTLFNTQKRGYFNFLFTKLQLRNSSFSEHGSSLWIRLLGVILLTSYFFYVIFEALTMFCGELAKKNFRKVISEKFTIAEDSEWTKSFSDRVISDFISFFSSFCKLFIELWAVISINLTREIKGWVPAKAFFCLLIILGGTLITEKIAKSSKKQITEEQTKFSSLFITTQQQLFSLEASLLFTTLYFLFFPNDNEMINAILLGYNLSSLLSKSRRFMRVIPQIASTYEVWKNAEKVHKKVL